MSRKFPCKHEVYELAEHAAEGEKLSALQAYAPGEFTWPLDAECFYCQQEMGPMRTPIGEVLRAKERA